MQREERDLETIPVGALGIVALRGCNELGSKIDNYIVDWRRASESEHKSTIAFAGYQRDTYLMNTKVCISLIACKSNC